MGGQYRIAADIGGTFTDIALITGDDVLRTWKLPSTPANYADAVIEGVTALMAEQNLPLGEIEQVLHGCTIATNAILEHKGANTAVLTTKGFRDVLEMRRVRVPRLYEPLYVKPPPLVPRQRRFEVDERMGARGEVVRPLDMASVEQAVAAVKRHGCDAVAVCLINSYTNPIHEQQIGEVLQRELPGCFISLSVDTLPQMREYERTSTTVVNAYVGPPVKAYLQSMMDQLSAAGVHGRLMVMQSSGGILDASTVIDKPAEIVECGPAAGVIGAARVGQMKGYDNLITFDMGGTTAKASVVESGELIYCDEYEVGGDMSSSNSLVKGGGYALKLPVIDISEVGAGGGSIVWLDKANSIKVGPHSAGAVPGPVCYDAGGSEPTITDANVVLGFVNPEALAGGTVPVRADLAKAAIEEKIARPLGRDVYETAFGIHTVANANMMHTVKAVTTYRGRDPRDFSLFAFGGSGGVHAVELAKVLQIKQVILPAAAGVFSAVGLLCADVQTNVTRAFHHDTQSTPLDEAEQICDELEAEVARRIGRERGDIACHRLADMRYGGQAFELTVPVPDGPITEATMVTMAERFEAEHEKRYGHSFTGEYAIETVNLRVVGKLIGPRVEKITRQAPANGDATSQRRVYFGPAFGFVESPVIDRSSLTNTAKQGPMIIEEYEGTAVVPPDCTAARDEADNVVIEVGDQS